MIKANIALLYQGITGELRKLGTKNVKNEYFTVRSVDNFNCCAIHHAFQVSQYSCTTWGCNKAAYAKVVNICS